MKRHIRVAIFGVNGYVGQTLAQLVLKHPALMLTAIFSRDIQIGKELLTTCLEKARVYSMLEIKKQSHQYDVLLLATPPQVSMEVIAQISNSNKIIIDLSGAFRLSENDFSKWYGMPHQAPQLMDQFVYGLSPWWYGNNTVEQVKWIANPGCYATCALMSLLPLIKHNVIQTDNIIIDAKSGASGAGRQANPDLLFCALANNFYPYKIGQHQHIPEIRKYVSRMTGVDCYPFLITHLLPLVSGISMALYLDAQEHLNSKEKIMKAIDRAYSEAYVNYPLVRIGSSEHHHELLALKNVVGKPNTHITYYVKKNKILIFSCIDNLYKGAASQAIENLNVLLDLPIETGLHE